MDGSSNCSADPRFAFLQDVLGGSTHAHSPSCKGFFQGSVATTLRPESTLFGCQELRLATDGAVDLSTNILRAHR
jgi:hypothetical protein